MQEAITWANIDPDLCHYMASLVCVITNLFNLVAVSVPVKYPFTYKTLKINKNVIIMLYPQPISHRFKVTGF